MNNIVNTRISIRNDELSNWVSSDVTLLKGELALARRPDGDSEGAGTYELRIGVGDKKWQQLDPGNFAISASQVIGLSSTVSQLSTAHYEAESLDQLSDYSTYNNGDTAVVKSLIAGEGADAKYSYTAYVWNAELTGDNKWAAMDGNYRADNVYFNSNMVMTEDFGKYKVPDAGSFVLSSGGKSVAELISDAYSDTKHSAKTNPTFTFTLDSYTANKEVGDTYTIPKATLKMTGVGSYDEYPPQPATGISVLVGNASVKSPEMENARTNSTAMVLNSTLSTDAGSTSHTYTLTSTEYQYTASATYTQGAVPNNNLGVSDPDNCIPSGTYTQSKTATFTGKRYYFWGYKTDGNQLDVTDLSSSDIRNLGNLSASMLSAKNSDAAANFSVPSGTKQIIFAAPHNALQKKIAVYNKSSLNAKVDFDNANARVENAVQVEGKNSYEAAAYDIWYVTFGATLNASNLVVTWE